MQKMNAARASKTISRAIITFIMKWSAYAIHNVAQSETAPSSLTGQRRRRIRNYDDRAVGFAPHRRVRSHYLPAPPHAGCTSFRQTGEPSENSPYLFWRMLWKRVSGKQSKHIGRSRQEALFGAGKDQIVSP